MFSTETKVAGVPLSFHGCQTVEWSKISVLSTDRVTR